MATDVSVVIPSCGRRSLATAVRSAARQHGTRAEVIVVDASGAGRARWIADDPSVSLYVDAKKQLAPGAARWLGCTRSTGQWVAFLDDDDVFLTRKSLEQIGGAAAAQPAIVTCDYALVGYRDICELRSAGDHEWESAVTGVVSHGEHGPRQPPTSGETLTEYLFKRQSVRSRKRIVTSSIVIDGCVARETPWSRHLERFEDWEWLIRVSRSGIPWHHVRTPLVGIGVNSERSLSAATTSLDVAHRYWPVALLYDDAPRALGDLLTCDIGVTLADRDDVGGARRMYGVARVVGSPGWQASVRLACALVIAATRRVMRFVRRGEGART